MKKKYIYYERDKKKRFFFLQTVKRIDLSSLVCTASRLNYITADYGEDGRVFVYVSDAATRAVIVWDVTGDRGYRVVLPKAITHDCTGRRDVLYIALALRPSGDNVLYLTYLTSNRMYAVDTCKLRRGCSPGTVADLGPKPDRIVILGTDGRTTVYFRYRGRGDVYAWDKDRTDYGTTATGCGATGDGCDCNSTSTAGCFSADRFTLVRKADDCGRLATQVAPGLRCNGVLWILESNFPDYISGTVGCLGANVRLQPLVDTRCDGYE